MYLENYHKIEKWLKTHNWSIQTKDNIKEEGGILDFANKTIYLSADLDNIKKIFVLLHESGHILIHRNIKSYTENYPVYSMLERGKKPHLRRTLEFKVETLSEEMKAWEKGYNLAKRLNIRINKKKWIKFKNKCLLSYIKWVSS
jgi:hypothetical protein